MRKRYEKEKEIWERERDRRKRGRGRYEEKKDGGEFNHEDGRLKRGEGSGRVKRGREECFVRGK